MNTIRILLTALLCWVSAAAAAQSGSFQTFRFTAQDGQERPYIVYTPPHVEAGEPRPLLVHLHGAIASPQIRSDPLASVQRSSFLKLANAGRYYVLFPFGQKDAGWFDPVGVNMVLGEVDAVLRDFPAADPDRVFLSGFSDGGSGTLYLAATHPDRFAGFIAMNGSLPVAAHLGSTPVYPQNFNRKPLYIINTRSDMLYPADMMQPVAEELRRHHPNLIFSTPEGGHDMRYLPQEIPALTAFIDRHRRQTATQLVWESSGEAANGSEWLHIERLKPQATPQAWHRPYRLTLFNNKASFGMAFDPAYRNGLKVAGFGKENSTAQNIGVRIGDIVLKMGETAMNHPYAPYLYLADKRAGDPVDITVLRDGRETVLRGRFNEGYHYQVFEKQPVSGKIRARIDRGRLLVDTSRVAAFRIDFSRLPQPVHSIVINGKTHPAASLSGSQLFETE
ncbi:PHB depolymerase family esterase [Neisseria shayeganii]|uniref:Phospholipase n=1 Tax=Neisseria shayeganii TaxID=607712 RepID=A0A7D7S5R5_9NEIS|nr:PHB depolymerase family esterase [Neisseria shayeganii]QMT41026.1 phospholipase [Neisseria shayeganii]